MEDELLPVQEELSPINQLGFGHLFDKLILKVNEDFGFNIKRDSPLSPCDENDLNYDESKISVVDLYGCGGYEQYKTFSFQTTFVEDYTDKSLETALENLEINLRAAMREIKDWKDENES